MNGVVFGATFDSNEYKIVHTMVSCMEELSKIRKSKYVESDFKRVEPDIERNIDKNRYILVFWNTMSGGVYKKKVWIL